MTKCCNKKKLTPENCRIGRWVQSTSAIRSADGISVPAGSFGGIIDYNTNASRAAVEAPQRSILLAVEWEQDKEDESPIILFYERIPDHLILMMHF
jgi:hypothetical protein